jgi:serine/threonine-protein kinase
MNHPQPQLGRRRRTGGKVARRIGPYRLLSRLAAGGMGEIYVGYHEHLRRHVAIKVALGEGASFEFLQSQLTEEARCLGAVSHANVVTVHDFGYTDDGVAYLVMDLLEGKGLHHIIDDGGPLPVPVAAQVARQVAEGLAAFHAESIVCADVKPDNVMVVGGPLVGLPLVEHPWIKLLDLGTARTVREEGQMATDLDKPILGTSWYMSPEAVLGLGLDERADVYSLGVLLHEMIVGQVPFLDDSDDAILNMHLWRQPRSLASALPGMAVGCQLDRLCRSCLSKSPMERPCSMYEFIDLLDDALAEWAQTHAPERIEATRPRLNHPASRAWLAVEGGQP